MSPECYRKVLAEGTGAGVVAQGSSVRAQGDIAEGGHASAGDTRD